MRKHFNDEIRLTQVDFYRNPEGVYVEKAEPLHVSYELIKSWGDGRIDLEGGNTVLVKEDAKTISRLRDEILARKEEYEVMLRIEDRLGLEGEGLV